MYTLLFVKISLYFILIKFLLIDFHNYISIVHNLIFNNKIIFSKFQDNVNLSLESIVRCSLIVKKNDLLVLLLKVTIMLYILYIF